jgi:polyferredoxin
VRQIRIFRIFLAILFFVATVAYLFIGPQVHPMAVVSKKAQIILSAGTTAIGAILTWLVITFIFGRIYCSTVCPIGTLSDLFIRIRRRIPALDKKFSYRKQTRLPIHILMIYAICLLAGAVAVPYIIEPWNIMRNIASAINPSAIEATWINLGLGIGTGITAGIVSFVMIAAYSLLRGREFCTHICPLGTAMGLLYEHNIYHIEIDRDKCVYCGKCEENCKSSCIKTVSAYVDNSRCIRCFDCLAVCPEEAIRFQPNRNRPATPLFRKSKQPQP